MLGESHETCGQDYSPGGSRGLHLFGSSCSDQQCAEGRSDADVLPRESKLPSNVVNQVVPEPNVGATALWAKIAKAI